MADRNTPVVAYLGLGSNLGDRLDMMRATLVALRKSPEIQIDSAGGIAPLYETSPVGGPANQQPYFNSAVRVLTMLTPHDLLDAVLSIEQLLGRARGERWGARVIDIDLLFYGDLVISDDRLTLPHACLHERRFVLDPLSEIAPNLIHPVLKSTIMTLARRVRSERTFDSAAMVAGAGWHERSSAAVEGCA